MKSFLKRVIARADERGYRYTMNVKKKKKRDIMDRKAEGKILPSKSPGNILLSGLLAELDKEASEKHNADNMSTSKGSDGGSSLLYSGVIRSISNDKVSNDKSQPDIKD
eukprot:4659501-Ditylum_brightwellii.AAC.1